MYHRLIQRQAGAFQKSNERGPGWLGPMWSGAESVWRCDAIRIASHVQGATIELNRGFVPSLRENG